MKKNKIIQYLIIAILTGILFLVGLYWAVRVVTPMSSIESFYDEPKNSIDVLIVGGSHAMCSISPTEIYDSTGLTSYNLSTWSQPIWVSYHYIQEALKYQKPKVVVLDVFGSFYDRSYLTGVDVDLVSDDYAQLMKPSLNLLSLNFTRFRTQVTKKVWSEYLNIAKYHSRITELQPEDIGKIFQDDSTTAKGYGPFYTMESFVDYVYPQTDQTTELYPYAQEYLLKTIALLKEKGIIPLLVKIPHIADENDITLVNTIKEIAQEQQVEFLDFCSSNVLNMDFSTDFADHGHVNNYGAKKVTGAVIESLQKMELSVVHSDKISMRWEEASKLEKDESQKMEIKLAKSLQEFADRVEQHQKTSVVLVKQDMGGLNEQEYLKMESLLQGTCLADITKDMQQERVFVYTQGKVLVGEQATQWCEEKEIALSDKTGMEISFAGESYSYGREGWNVALYDDEQQQIYHHCSLAKEHDYTPYTE